MKTFRLIGMALIGILFSVSFTSCGGDDAEMFTTYNSNAKGVEITIRGTDYEEENWYYFINNDYLLLTNDSPTINGDSRGDGFWDFYVKYGNPYKRFTMEVIYDYLSDSYGVPTDEHTDLSTFEYTPEAQTFVDCMKSKLSKYDYIVCYEGFPLSVALFNRTSNENFK